MEPIRIFVRSKGSKFEVEHDGVLLGCWRTPFLSAARHFLRHGEPQDRQIEMWRRGSTGPALTGVLGVAARWTVEDSDDGVRFRRFKEFPAEGGAKTPTVSDLTPKVLELAE